MKYKLKAQANRIDTLLQEKRAVEEKVKGLEEKYADSEAEKQALQKNKEEQGREIEDITKELGEMKMKIKEQGEAMTQLTSKLQIQLVEEQTEHERFATFWPLTFILTQTRVN